MIEAINSHNVVALAKAVKDKEFKACRSDVEPGEHVVDFLVHVHGSITVSQDTVRTQPNTIPWQEMAAALLSDLHPSTREKFLRDFLANEERPSLTEATQRMIERLVGTTKRVARGAVRPDLHVEQVDSAADASRIVA